LDPACGSGTFLFSAVRRLRASGLSGTALVAEAQSNIIWFRCTPSSRHCRPGQLCSGPSRGCHRCRPFNHSPSLDGGFACCARAVVRTTHRGGGTTRAQSG
jgi:hypothetical protein